MHTIEAEENQPARFRTDADDRNLVNFMIARFAACVLLSASFAVPLAATEHVRGYAPAVKARIILQTSVTSSGERIIYPSTPHPQVTMVHVIIPPGQETGWHLHPVPGFAYVLAGTLMVETQHGRHIFHKGDGFAESVNVLHNGKNIGTAPVELLVTFIGSVRKPFVIKASAQP